MGHVPVLAAETGTGIISQISYNQRTDELLGFYGVKGTEHKCLGYFTVSVGDGEEGSKSIVNAFEHCKIGTYGGAILLNPLHKKLPRIDLFRSEVTWSVMGKQDKEKWRLRVVLAHVEKGKI